MYTSPRRKLNADVIPFPATAAPTGSDLVLTSEDLYPFEGTGYGPMTVVVGADEAGNITGTIDVDVLVSWDEGMTWATATSSSILAAGSGAVSEVLTLNYAPRVRVQATLEDGTDELAAGHECVVHVEQKEVLPEYRRQLNADLIDTTGDVAAGATVLSEVIELEESVERLALVSWADTNTGITDATLQIETSFDGVHWWDLLDTAVALGSLVYDETDNDETNPFGRYVRVALVTAGGTGAVAEADGLVVNLVEFSR